MYGERGGWSGIENATGCSGVRVRCMSHVSPPGAVCTCTWVTCDDWRITGVPPMHVRAGCLMHHALQGSHQLRSLRCWTRRCNVQRRRTDFVTLSIPAPCDNSVSLFPSMRYWTSEVGAMYDVNLFCWMVCNATFSTPFSVYRRCLLTCTVC